MEIIKLILQVVVPVLQGGLVVLMFRRGAHRRFRIFYTYTIFAVVTGVLRSIVSVNKPSYFYVYYYSEIPYAALCLLAIHESFRYVFRNFYRLPGFRFLFPGVAAVMLFIAAFRSYLLHPSEMNSLMSTVFSLEIAIDFLQVGTFGLFFLLALFFKMRWRQHAFGVVLGFGVNAIANLIFLLLRFEFGTRFDKATEVGAPMAYCIGVVVWLAAFARPEPVQPHQDWVPPLTPEALIAELRQYTRVTKGVLRQ